VANDPHLLESEFQRVQMANDAYAATHSAVNAETASKLHTAVADQAGSQLSMTAAKAMIDQDPVKGLADVNASKFMADHLKPEERDQLGKYAENMQRINDEHQKSVQVEQRRQNVSQANQTAIQAMTDGMNTDGSMNGSTIRDAIHKLSGMPDVPEGLVRSMFDMQKVANEDAARGFKVKTDQPTFNALVNKVYDTDKPLQLKDVFQAQADRKLNTADAAELREQLRARDNSPRNQFEQDTILSTRKAAFAALNYNGSPSGYRAVQKFEYAFNQQYQHASPEQRDKMLDPSSPTYVLSPANLAKFKSSDDLIEAPPPAGTPKKSLGELMQQHFSGEE